MRLDESGGSQENPRRTNKEKKQRSKDFDQSACFGRFFFAGWLVCVVGWYGESMHSFYDVSLLELRLQSDHDAPKSNRTYHQSSIASCFFLSSRICGELPRVDSNDSSESAVRFCR